MIELKENAYVSHEQKDDVVEQRQD